jgi:hypothetical protein
MQKKVELEKEVENLKRKITILESPVITKKKR